MSRTIIRTLVFLTYSAAMTGMLGISVNVVRSLAEAVSANPDSLGTLVYWSGFALCCVAIVVALGLSYVFVDTEKFGRK